MCRGPQVVDSLLPALPPLQRYISTRPIFKTWEGRLGAAGSAGAGAGSGAGNAAPESHGAGSSSEAAAPADPHAALKGLSGLYKSIATTMRDEAVVIEQVFPSPYTALALFIQRLFEQKARTAAELLAPLWHAGPACPLRETSAAPVDPRPTPVSCRLPPRCRRCRPLWMRSSAVRRARPRQRRCMHTFACWQTHTGARVRWRTSCRGW